MLYSYRLCAVIWVNLRNATLKNKKSQVSEYCVFSYISETKKTSQYLIYSCVIYDKHFFKKVKVMINTKFKIRVSYSWGQGEEDHREEHIDACQVNG